MHLFVVRGDPAFSMLQPVHEGTWQARGGLPVSMPWEEIELTPGREGSAEFIPVDCLTINTGADGFLVSAFARDVLLPLLDGGDEFWPVRVCGLPYWWLNCMALVDALDRKKTDADWSMVEGDWGSFSWITTTRRLAFRPSRLKRAPMLFRVPEYPQGALFALEALRVVVERHGLTGFMFELVWSAGAGGVLHPAGVGFGGMFAPLDQAEVERRRSLAKQTLEQRER